MSLLISGAMVDSEERLLDRWEEPALLIVDRIVQGDGESAQRPTYLTRLCFDETVRAGVSHGANELSQSVVVCADLAARIRRETALLLQPRQ
jgi:hypothetical protein